MVYTCSVFIRARLALCHDNYLKIKNFDNSSDRNISSSIKLIGDIQQEIARQMSKHHQVVTHYITEHGYISLWDLVNNQT